MTRRPDIYETIPLNIPNVEVLKDETQEAFLQRTDQLPQTSWATTQKDTFEIAE